MEFPKPTNRQTAKEKQRSRYETLIFTRLVLLVAVPLLIVGLLCGILYYRSEPARGQRLDSVKCNTLKCNFIA